MVVYGGIDGGSWQVGSSLGLAGVLARAWNDVLGGPEVSRCLGHLYTSVLGQVGDDAPANPRIDSVVATQAATPPPVPPFEQDDATFVARPEYTIGIDKPMLV